MRFDKNKLEEWLAFQSGIFMYTVVWTVFFLNIKAHNVTVSQFFYVFLIFSLAGVFGRAGVRVLKKLNS